MRLSLFTIVSWPLIAISLAFSAYSMWSLSHHRPRVGIASIAFVVASIAVAGAITGLVLQLLHAGPTT